MDASIAKAARYAIMNRFGINPLPRSIRNCLLSGMLAKMTARPNNMPPAPMPRYGGSASRATSGRRRRIADPKGADAPYAPESKENAI